MKRCVTSVLVTGSYIKSQEMRVISVLPVASCKAQVRDFLEMTVCAFDSTICITVYVWCTDVMHYDLPQRTVI